MIFPFGKRLIGKKMGFFLLGFFLLSGFFALPGLANADAAGAAGNALNIGAGLITTPVASIIGGLLLFYSTIAGGILLLLTMALTAVSNFNQFVQAEAVVQGWKIIRDVCNMIFVLILLAIAIGTILQQEKYHYSKMLFPFISAAILINFSKTICGIIIDAAQVVMMTFVGAYSQAIGGNFFLLIGAQNFWRNVTDVASQGFDPLKVTNIMETLGTIFLAATMITVAIVVVFVMVMVLIARIVALWFLVVLSPFAFALSVLPSTQKYAERWWKDFTNNVITGPAMAFFLWLSLAVVSVASEGVNDAAEVTNKVALDNFKIEHEKFQDKNVPRVGNATSGTLPGILNYLLGIGMLLGTLMISQELGAAGSKIAGSAAGGLKDMLSGKTGLVPWQTMGKEALSAAGGRLMKPWKERGQRAGAFAGQMVDVAMSKTIGHLSTKADRARAAQRQEHYLEETSKRNIQSFAEGGEFAKLTPKEIREQLAKEKNKTRRAALVNELNKNGELGNGPDGDKGLIKQQVDFLGKKGGAGMIVEFDDQLKKSNLSAAYYAGRFNDHHGHFSEDKFQAEWRQGKFSSDSVTDGILKEIIEEGEHKAIDRITADIEVNEKRIRSLGDQIVKEKNPEKKTKLIEEKEKIKQNNASLLTARHKKEEELEKSKQIEESNKRVQDIKDKLEKSTDPKEQKMLERELASAEEVVAEQGDDLKMIVRDKWNALAQAGIKSFGEKFVGGMKDAKQIHDKVGSMTKDAWRVMEANMSILGDDVNRSQKVAFARAKGGYSTAFNFKNKEDQEIFANDIMNVGERRDEFYKQVSGLSTHDEGMADFITTNNDWKAAYSQRVAVSRDNEKKRGFAKSYGNIVRKANRSGKRDLKSQRARNALQGFTRKDDLFYKNEKGETVAGSIFDLQGEMFDQSLISEGQFARQWREAHEQELGRELDESKEDDKSMIEKLRYEAAQYYNDQEYRVISNRDFRGKQIRHDRTQSDEIEDHNPSTMTDEFLDAVDENYSSEQGRKIVSVNKTVAIRSVERRKERVKKRIEFAKKQVGKIKQQSEDVLSAETKQIMIDDVYKSLYSHLRGTFQKSNRENADNYYSDFDLQKPVKAEEIHNETIRLMKTNGLEDAEEKIKEIKRTGVEDSTTASSEGTAEGKTDEDEPQKDD